MYREAADFNYPKTIYLTDKEKTVKISWRIAGDEVRYQDLSARLGEMIKNHPESFDEISLFTDINEQCYESLDDMRKNADKISEHIRALKSLGVKSVGINILNTIGQNDDGWDFLEVSPFQTMIGHDGTKTRGSICMRADGFLDYMCQKYRIYSDTGADFLWVDDDMRIAWHGALFPCFCEKCVSDFSALTGTVFTRETLVKALDDTHSLRYDWMKFNADKMCEHVRACADAAREVNPKIKLGLMTVGLDTHLYNLNNFEDMMQALGADMLRPGGGYWTADAPADYFKKCLSVAYQIEKTPSATDIQYESETIPHLKSKPKRIHDLEICAAVMSGCNGITIDDVRVSEPHYYLEMIGLIEKRREFLDGLAKKLEGKRLAGGYAVVRDDACAKTLDGKFFPSNAISAFSNECRFFNAGFGFTAKEENADYFVLSSDMCDALSDDEIRYILSRGVIMDGYGAHRLSTRGFASLCGYKSSKTHTNGLKTVYTAHPFNTAPVGMRRGGLQADFRSGKGIYVIDPDEKAQILTECKSINEIYLGASDYIYENSLGGRVAVLGYAPWTNFEQRERVDMLRNIVEWISFGSPSLSVSGAYNILPILQTGEDGSFCLMLTNASLDPSGDFEVSVKGDASVLEIYDSRTGALSELTVSAESGRCKISVSSIEPWDFKVIMTKQ